MTPQRPDSTAESQRQAVESVSPEGRPADPAFGGCGTATIVGAIAILLVLIGVGVAFAFSLAAGVATAAVGVVVFAVNPVLWASIGRAKERSKVLHDSED